VSFGKDIFKKISINGRQLLKIEFLAVFAAAAVIISVLFTGPVIGVADNSDFKRVMEPAGLNFLSVNRFAHIDIHFRIKDADSIEGRSIPDKIAFAVKSLKLYKSGQSDLYVSTQILPVKPALMTNIVVSSFASKSIELFDIRYLALIYSLILVAAIFLIIRAGKKAV